MEDLALTKLIEMQSKSLSYDEMLANRIILNFYCNFADNLENHIKQSQYLAESVKKKVVS
jgi:hypothetical protein